MSDGLAVLGVLVALVFFVLGAILTVTVVGAVVGIPLMIGSGLLGGMCFVHLAAKETSNGQAK